MSSFRLATPCAFRLGTVLLGHGWVDLAPHRWDEQSWSTVLVAARGAVDVEIRQQRDALAVTSAGRASRHDLERQLSRMLRFDLDLAPFWKLCAAHERLRWVRARGAGRLLRSATLFEDLMKLLFTTNCSWAATRLMTQRTIDALGPAAPSGRRAFPDAATCASEPERFWRDVVRAGYRARSCVALARAFATGELDEAHFDGDAATVRERLLALPGFGPYAAGQALRLLGWHEDLALDSWCRATFAKLRGKKRAPSDRTIAREYRHFGAWQGLALWMDLTREWHEGAAGQ